MVKVGTMIMEQKQQPLNSTTSGTSSIELVFTDKEVDPCVECDKKADVEIKTENWTFEELTNILPLLDKYGLTRQETDYIYNLYNRIFKLNKQPGCGKCTVNIIKQLKAKHNQLLNSF